jgi:hypothetical protein
MTHDPERPAPAVPRPPHPSALTPRARAAHHGWAVDPARTPPPPHPWGHCHCRARTGASLRGCPCLCHGRAYRVYTRAAVAPDAIRRWGPVGSAPKLSR